MPELAPSGHPLFADPARVVARLFAPSEDSTAGRSRAREVVDRVLALTAAEASALTARIVAEFGARHPHIEQTFLEHAEAVLSRLETPPPLGRDEKLLVGATFTSEYAIEGGALCNPSAVAHPDQSGLGPGQLRVAVALRAIGEGHLSSIAFAEAVAGPGASWAFAPRAAPLLTATITDSNWSRRLLHAPADDDSDYGAAYHADFPVDSALSQRALLPVAAEEAHGMEDARFVLTTEPGVPAEYRATYTAYDGSDIAPRLITSPDLRRFSIHRPTGSAAQNKGMALFPRRIAGSYRALARTDGVSISLARSDDGLAWEREDVIHSPGFWWELVQTGNCGSPIETDAGWLVLTHGVGPMRTYSIGALLLDLDEPSRVIAVTAEPILSPRLSDRDGYVPNVVYSCGGLVHDGLLWLPYGIGDDRVDVTSIRLVELLAVMVAPTP